MGIHRKKTTKDVLEKAIIRSSQIHGEDLTGMIIVKKTIFSDLMRSVSEEALINLICSNFLEAPLADDIEFGEWIHAQFIALGVKVGARTQAEFGNKLDLTQGDFSKLLNYPDKISIGIERKKHIQDVCKSLIKDLTKKAS